MAKASEHQEVPNRKCYGVHVSEVRYGYVRVVANSESEAEEYAKELYKREYSNIRWHDQELTDVSAGG